MTKIGSLGVNTTMKKRLVFSLVVFLTVTSCGPSTPGTTENASAATESFLVAVQTSVAETDQANPPEPPTSTSTPIPSPSITPSPTPPPGLALARLLRRDLPPQFEQLEPAAEGFHDGQTPLSMPGRLWGEIQLFLSPYAGHLIVVQSSFIQTESDRDLYDEMTTSEALFRETVVAAIPQRDGIQYLALSVPADLGEVRAGVTLILPADEYNPATRNEIVTFRRGPIVVEVYSMYVESETVAVTAVEIAQILDDRLLAGGAAQ